MRARNALTVSALVAVLVTAAAIPGAQAAKKTKHYLHPKYESFGVRKIGILPWLERKQDLDAERIMRIELAQGLEPTGYSFTNAVVLRTMARSVGAESLFVACMDQFRDKGEIRAGTLQELGSRISVDAVLVAFLDRWEQEVVPITVRGNSRTEIGARLVLYSARTGELLWSEYLEMRGEGPYNDPSTGEIGTTPLQGRAGPTTGLEPPSYEEIADKWSQRLTQEFPPPPKPREEAGPKSEDTDP